MATKLTVKATINAPVNKVWEYYNNPILITQWNAASEDWHSPRAENDLKEGGRFNYRMEAKDGSNGFDFTGIYNQVKENELIKYTMDDGREVTVKMNEDNGSTNIEITFDAESDFPLEYQQEGWQAILNNFKKYLEN